MVSDRKRFSVAARLSIVQNHRVKEESTMAPRGEPTVYDLAYRGQTAAIAILINENEKLKTQTDPVGIISPFFSFKRFSHLIERRKELFFTQQNVLDFLQNGRMLSHWAALGGHDDLIRYLLSLGVPADPPDDVIICIYFLTFRQTIPVYRIHCVYSLQ